MSLRQRAYAALTAALVTARHHRPDRPLLAFLRDGGLGDLLCTFPTAIAIRERFPDHHSVFLCNASLADLPRLASAADAVRPIRCNDLVAAALARRAGVRTARFRYPDEDGPAGSPPPGQMAHLVDEFARSQDVDLRDRQPRLRPPAPGPDAARILHATAGGPRVCVHAGPTWKVRELPATTWERAVTSLLNRGIRVIQVGALSHFRDGASCESALHGALDARNKLDLAGTAAVLAAADAFAGIDSGLLHLAGAVGTPSLGVFGPVDPDRRLPPSTPSIGVVAARDSVPCLGCHHRAPRLHWEKGCPHDIRCMQAVTPESITTAILDLLSRAREPRPR